MKRTLLRLIIWGSGLVWWFALMLTYDAALSTDPVVHRADLPEHLIFITLIVTLVVMNISTFLWFWWGFDKKQ